ncbi:MAG: helix-turn-helix domain-containing protein [Bacteroidetes bacterium]|nr:helix-turn-helix domain-containing protein [Bacteroidota bacterium]
MSVKSVNARIILGLKIKQRRQLLSMSFSDLSSQSGLSISYLNEIEKGKKYPKKDKLQALAKTLKISYQELISSELYDGLAPVGDLLRSNFLNELPLDLFGIELSKVVEIIANAPARVGAFISTLVEMSRNYALGEESFYFGALRAFLELHSNYFEGIEEKVDQLIQQYRIPDKRPLPAELLGELLEDQFGYTIVEKGLDRFPELKDLRSVFLPERKQLLLSGNLRGLEKTFQFAKELGFNFLQISERAKTSSISRVNTFEEVLNHSKAIYFSVALLMRREPFVEDVRQFFSRSKWDEAAFLSIMEKYHATPDMYSHRLTNIMPRFFEIRKLFFLRFIYDPKGDGYKIDRELHLEHRHHPHGNSIREHYCRRWISVTLLQDLKHNGEKNKTIVGAQRSAYFGTEDEYLCLTIARTGYPAPENNVSVTLGLLINPHLQQSVRFLNDPAIPKRIVNKTCERCPIEDCQERAASPKIVEKKQRWQRVQVAIDQLSEER